MHTTTTSSTYTPKVTLHTTCIACYLLLCVLRVSLYKGVYTPCIHALSKGIRGNTLLVVPNTGYWLPLDTVVSSCNLM